MAKFSSAVSYVFGNEGGFQNKPSDPGNWWNGENIGTNHGIAGKTARELGYQGPMQDLTKDAALDIYERMYWPGLEMIESQAVATKLLDLRVQFGVGGGTLLAQKAVNQFEGFNISEDGGFGPQTKNAINEIEPGAYLEALATEAEARYRADVARHPEKAEWLDGWLDRAWRFPSDNPGTAAAIGLGMIGMLFFLGKK